MLPLLADGRDKVFLSKPKSTLKKNDVVFYQRNDGQYVLHRIIRINDDELVMRGDNQRVNEYGISLKNVIAIATAFERKGKYIHCSDFRYKSYCFFLPVTRFFRKIYAALIKSLKKINQKRKRLFNKKVK